MNTPDTTRTVTVQGARIRVRTDGDTERPPVLLLHGIGRSLEDWAPQHDLLADSYRVISVDLPGFGLSDPVPGPVTLPTLARTMLGVLDELGETRPAHVMGNSLGGAVAMQMLIAAPDRIASLGLVNSAGFGPEVTLLLRLLCVPVLGEFMLRRTDRVTLRQTERVLFRRGQFVTRERLEHARRVSEHPHRSRVFLEMIRKIGTVRGVRSAWREALLADAARHPKPMLIVWGSSDLILPARHLDAARARFPEARSHLFEHTGHMPQIERAEEFAALARELFRQTDTADETT